MQINAWTFWGVLIFTSAGTAALDLIFPPSYPEIATVLWIVFTIIGAAMILYGWGKPK